MILTSAPNERVIEVPWALMHLPQTGTILDVGSCQAAYLSLIQQPGRQLHCLDPRECGDEMPAGAVFHHGSLIGCDLPTAAYDAVLLLSVLEHIGLPCYGQAPFLEGDRLALAEAGRLLKRGCPLLVTVPAGPCKLVSWYRQYCPTALRRLFEDWQVEICYWGFSGKVYVPIPEAEVEQYDYRDYLTHGTGAGALAAVIAHHA